MQENRGFDHYFGTMKGVRGFGDRFPVPLESGKPVWYQSNGAVEIAPFHLDPKKFNALLAPSTTHSFADSQAAWNQGKFGNWPKYKKDNSMGYYKREDIPFQFALAEAFTLCDAYHCSITSGTDPDGPTIHVDGTDVADWGAAERDVALVLQRRVRQAKEQMEKVYGPTAAHYMTAFASGITANAADLALSRLDKYRNATGGTPTAKLRLEMQHTMQKHAAVFRDSALLAEGVDKMHNVYAGMQDVGVSDRSLIWNTDLVETLELDYLDQNLTWVPTWPASPDSPALPRAVRLQLVLGSGERILRLFAVDA